MEEKKLFQTIIFIIIVLLQLNCYSQCDLEAIMVELNSDESIDRYNALTEIEFCNLRESLDILEEKIHTESDFNIKILYLEVINYLGSENIQTIVYDFLDEINSFNPNDLLVDIEFARYDATRILFSVNDYRTIDYLFAYTNKETNLPALGVFSTLGGVIKYIPSYENLARQTLIDYVNNSSYDIVRATALLQLIKFYEDNEVNDICMDVSANDDSMGVRIVGFQGLFKFNHFELHSFLLERLSQDQSWYLRYIISDSLLNKFGEPSDLKVVKDYQPNEPDGTARSLMSYAIDEFIPPKPTSLNWQELITRLVSYTTEMFTYGWIANTKTRDYYISTLNLLNSQIERRLYAEACPTLNVKLLARIETDLQNNKITTEGYKFLHYYCVYIKEELNTLYHCE